MIPWPECHADCDEGNHDVECLVPDWEASYWAGYFGLRPGMTKAERAEQLERFRPVEPLP